MTAAATTMDVYEPSWRQKGYVSKPTVEMAATRPTPEKARLPRAQSLWALANMIDADVELAITPLLSCRHMASRLRHFNQLSVFLLEHCDFQSVQLPELNSALEALRQAQEVWVEAVALHAHGDFGNLADVTYADVDYPPRPRRYDAAVVRVDPPNVTRAKRVYTDDDAEVWGP